MVIKQKEMDLTNGSTQGHAQGGGASRGTATPQNLCGFLKPGEGGSIRAADG